ncbi:hypothetical protein C5167_008539 [Papaver somniferum]|uniref:F-box associated domain-containing protein n=1 Tax=Papaver somniferum TaxID=3469 RepID=A0A4Y7JW95_PAPSO|nr:hypothetical protein C5167_008539 [Papaver somniferum]
MNKDIIIWNPCTKVYKKIPNPPESTSSFPKHPMAMIQYGFGYDEKKCPNLDTGLPRTIGSFDLESETFKEIQLPQKLLDSTYMVGVEVWMMKEYGIKESWTKMFTIDGKFFGGAGYVNLKSSLGNRVIPVEVDQLFPFLYDLNKEEATQLEIEGISPSLLNLTSHRLMKQNDIFGGRQICRSFSSSDVGKASEPKGCILRFETAI